jgi:hypothetical protein
MASQYLLEVGSTSPLFQSGSTYGRNPFRRKKMNKKSIFNYSRKSVNCCVPAWNF